MKHSDVNACRSVTPSTRTSQWSPAFRATPTRKGSASRHRDFEFRFFFQFALAHHYVFGKHTPGRTNIWNRYLAVRDQLGTEVLGGGTGIASAPRGTARIRCALSRMRYDQRIYPARRENRREHLSRSSRTLCRGSHCGVRERTKPSVRHGTCGAGASDRGSLCAQTAMPSPTDGEIPTYPAYGTTIHADGGRYREAPEANRRRVLTSGGSPRDCRGHEGRFVNGDRDRAQPPNTPRGAYPLRHPPKDCRVRSEGG